MRKFSTIIALTAAMLSLAPLAHAADTEQRTTGVVYSDLDLATEAGRAELEHRIHRAAQQVCGIGETTVGTRIRSRDARECYSQARRSLDSHFAGILRNGANGG